MKTPVSHKTTQQTLALLQEIASTHSLADLVEKSRQIPAKLLPYVAKYEQKHGMQQIKSELGALSEKGVIA